MTLLALSGDVTEAGHNQGDIVRLLSNTKTLTDSLTTQVNALRSYILGNRLVAGLPGLARSTNFDVATGAILYLAFAGVLKTIASGAVADTGTAATFPATKWGIFKVSAASTGTLTATWATGVAAAGYASEALAVAALPATPAGEVSLGYVTVQAHATQAFIAGTDALASGTGGNVAAATNYTNATALDPASAIPAALTDTLTLQRG